MQKLEIPLILPPKDRKEIVISIEGCNGAGKTTLLNKYANAHPDVESTLCVPYIYQKAKDIKAFMLFQASALCSALYYLGGAVEIKDKHNLSYHKVLFDRSVWSTFAAAYAKDVNIIKPLFQCLEALKDKIFIPNHIVVLQTSYKTCIERINKKNEGGEFDKDDELIFERKSEFYNLLKNAGYNIDFIQTDEMTTDEVYNQFCLITEKLWTTEKD